MMNRRQFMSSGGALLWSTGFPVLTLSGADRPDVLFIAVEDLNTSLGCYGNPIVKTPNIDGLAARGMRFENAQCQYPLCNPSRSSLLSGFRPDTTKVLSNCDDWRTRLADRITLPQLFMSAGYDVLRCGKMFHRNLGRACRENPSLSLVDDSHWTRIIPENEGLPRRNQPARDPVYLYDVPADQRQRDYDTRAWAWGPTGRSDISERDGQLAEQGVRLLLQPRERPLFLALGFHKVHLPLQAPDRYFNLYNPAEIPLPPVPEDPLKGIPAGAGYNLRNHRQFTKDKWRQAIAAYYACCSFIDACVGRVLKALEDSGRAENTIIVFWGDHGFHLGEHGQWQKSTLFEESCRVPLIVLAPGTGAAGRTCSRPVELIDLYPTLAELCGLTPSGNLEGLSLVPLLESPDRVWKKAAFTRLRASGHSLRTERWRYTEWGHPDRAELYDHDNDRHELNNLAGNPDYSRVQRELSALLNLGWRAALPSGK